MSQNVQAELNAILNGAAIASLDDRAFLRVTGSDATRWLNGMVTNSVQALEPGEGCYAFLLNAQGRILGDLTVYREPDAQQAAFLLATSKQQIDAIQKHLDHFIIMDDVELQPTPNNEESLLLIGPDAPRFVDYSAGRGVNHGAMPPLHLAFDPETPDMITTPTAASVPIFEVRKSNFPEILDRYVTKGATPISAEALEAFRLLEGRPAYGRDITEKYLPQETNQTQALHFNKGCYLGQEIVERIRSRGQVHRLLTPLTLSGALPTEFPATIEADGKPVGEITSAALVPLSEGDQILGLGYVRREALDTHAPLTYAAGTAAPRAPQVQTAATASK